jgi:hypothetical protein
MKALSAPPRLTSQGLRLPILGNDNVTANREYIRAFVLKDNAIWGKSMGSSMRSRFIRSGLRETTRKNT